MKPAFLWEDPIEIVAGRQTDWLFSLYKPNGRPAAITGNDVVRFKLSVEPEDDTPLLDINSTAPLAGGSVIEIVALGTDDTAPAQVKVRFMRADTLSIAAGDEYFGEIGVVVPAADDDQNADAFKRAGYGAVRVLASPGGNAGLT
jgi:hypothetical protein